MTISILLNGQKRELLSPSRTVRDVIDDIGFKPDRVAVEVNGSIVSRALWSETTLADGDKVELVQFVGGGALDRDSRSLSHRSP